MPLLNFSLQDFFYKMAHASSTIDFAVQESVSLPSPSCKAASMDLNFETGSICDLLKHSQSI